MYDVPLLVDHDVAIVSVLDLKQVTHKRVSSHTLDEVTACLQGDGGMDTVCMSGESGGREEEEERERENQSTHQLKLGSVLLPVSNLKVLQ